MKLVGREREERRSGVKRDKGSLGSCSTHTHTQNMQETRHIRGHSWQKCKEEGWDRNNKQIMFMDSIYLIAVCVYECMGEYSVSSDCNPTTRLLGPFQVNLYGYLNTQTYTHHPSKDTWLHGGGGGLLVKEAKSSFGKLTLIRAIKWEMNSTVFLPRSSTYMDRSQKRLSCSVCTSLV